MSPYPHHHRRPSTHRPFLILSLFLLTSLTILLHLSLPTSPQPNPPLCPNPFHVSIPNTTNTPPQSHTCFVRSPPGYNPPLPDPLWQIPRSALGTLNTSDPFYHLHVVRQRWAYMDQHMVHIREAGGTAGRAFPDNFVYAKLIVQLVQPPPRCAGSRPVMLDSGAGIGSVAAAIKDHRGGKDRLQTLSYVLPDDYLRLQTIINHRGLNAYLANFTGVLPFPDQSLDIVHCKWCWHHEVGYSVWVDEVARVLVPGGFFVFTFTGVDGGILEEDLWARTLRGGGFECQRVKRIVQVCKKKGGDGAQFCPTSVRAEKKVGTRVETQAKVVRRVLEEVDKLGGGVLGVGCRKAGACMKVEEVLGIDMLHMAEDKAVVAGLLGRRRVAMLHDFGRDVPAYPRSFDAVIVGCGKGVGGYKFWVDLHRILRPRGVVVVMRALCGRRGVAREMRKALFDLNRVNGDVLVGTRMDVR